MWSNSSLISSTGCVSIVDSSSSFHIFIVLSHSPVINLIPDKSKVDEKIPPSAEIDPGYTLLYIF